MRVQLSDHFSYGKLIRFTLPSIGAILFTSIYGMIDGLFVSNFIGKTEFASINLIIPFLQILGGLGAMLGVGGSALVAKTLGEGDTQRAKRYFTMMIYLMVYIGVFCSVVGILFIRRMAYIFGASDAMIEDCVTYGGICLAFNTALLAQHTMQSYLVVAEKPKLGFAVTVIAGCTNIVLDFLFIAILDMGIAGAALATGISQVVGCVIPLVWFLSSRNTSSLRFEKTSFELKPILKACGNGVSEMMSGISGAVIGMMYNWQLMTHAGEDGVAAYGVVMYAAFIFVGVSIGYSSGCSPIMSYHYGANNNAEMQNVRKKSMILLFVSSSVLTLAAILLARPISSIFVSYDAELLKITIRAFTICAFPYLIMWFSIYTSSLFTALNDGVVSAIISVLRAFILPLVCIIVMPMFWELDGVWYSLVVSEILSMLVSIGFVVGKRNKYCY